MRVGKYIGSIPEIKNIRALVRDDKKRGRVLAQFDKQNVAGQSIRPGEGFDDLIPYCFGWHPFPESEFEFPRTDGHDPDCNCMECMPEPHSLDQLRRRY